MSVPALRFKDANGQDFPDWGSVALGEIITIMSGISPSSYELTASGVYPFLKVEDLNNNSKYQIESREYSNSKKNLVPKESIIFPKRGAAILNNKVRIALSPVLMDSNLMAITPIGSELNYEFLYYKILNDKLYKIADTSTIPQINNKHILPYIVSLPIVKEQTKIANFLTAVDEKIRLLTQKHDLLTQYKKGVMQQIFSQELRFKDHDGREFPEWEEATLGDVTELFSRRNKKLIDAKIYSVTNNNGFVLQTEHFEDRVIAGADLSNYKIIYKDEFAYNPARVNVGSIALFTEAVGVISSLYVCFKCKPALDKTFLLNFLELDSTKQNINSFGEGGVRIYLWYPLFAQIPITIPSINEQTKIANFLTAIDDKITQIQAQLDAVKQYKQGLLQQMFV